MLKVTRCCPVWVSLLPVIGASVAPAQQASPRDEAIDTIRGLTTIGIGDQGRVNGWVQGEVDAFADSNAFRRRFDEQYKNSGNSRAFLAQLATQTAQVAAAQFDKPDLNQEVAYSLARVLADMNRLEALPGLVAGTKSSDARARYLCAMGLTVLKASIASDPGSLNQTVQALRDAGIAESDPVVLGKIYEALAYPGQVGTVFDVYKSLLDSRLASRRGGDARRRLADGAEKYAYEFFRIPAVLGALNAEQKTQLAGLLAVFLRMDAQRYDDPDLGFKEIDNIERTLDGAEEILSNPALVGPGKGGDIRKALSTGGHGNRTAVLQQAYRWVGDPETKTPGALNAGPWNVPVGAP